MRVGRHLPAVGLVPSSSGFTQLEAVVVKRSPGLAMPPAGRELRVEEGLPAHMLML